MPRWTKLSQFEQSKILALHDRNIIPADIARKISDPLRFISLFMEYCSLQRKKRSERPTKLSSQDKRRTTRELERDNTSCMQLKHSLGLNMSKNTIWRQIRDQNVSVTRSGIVRRLWNIYTKRTVLSRSLKELIGQPNEMMWFFVMKRNKIWIVWMACNTIATI